MPMKRIGSVLILLSSLACAQGTRTWQQSSFDDFEKGTAKAVAIRSEGALELAPAFKLLYTTPATYVWAIASDAAGNVYLATGSPARVYRVTPAGVATVIFEPKELQVQALVVAANGVVFAGTSPDGKVYRIAPNAAPAETKKPEGKKGKAKAEGAPAPPAEAAPAGEVKPDSGYTASVYFDPKTKYIWDLALDKQGGLYVASGDRGEIFRVAPTGEGTVFFKSDEAHIRVLALDNKDNLIAGSDGSGLVYRISPAGEAFVLYSAPKKEITALALDKEGNIYAAGVGEKRPSGASTPPGSSMLITMGSNPQAPSVGPMPGGPVPTIPSTITLGAFPVPGAGASGGSDVYRIA